MKLRGLTAICLVIGSVVTSAQTIDDIRVKLALQLLELTDARGNMERAITATMNAQLEALAANARRMGAPEILLKKIGPLQEELKAMVMAELKWDIVARDAALVHSSVFTEDELRSMVAFYESPAGRAMVARTPEISTRMIEITKLRMTTIEPKVLELIKKHFAQ